MVKIMPGFKGKVSCLETCEAYKILLSLFIQRSYYDDTIDDTLQSLGKEHTVME